ncbi:NAD(P)-dependent oxidoreductase [Streptomyces sp. XY431]|uniref:NAD-dependent epimerase/dehydratase family protein n=1 Tax=Streptomyces sp. XY431 TaxID=1415562 RepID=UPI000A7A4F48|nr:NAD(P)-dependent oxidoreductase [Streptomyces sp. XY431]
MDASNEPSQVRLSGAVMSHPKRAEEARRIADADPLGRIRVITDPEPSGRPTALRVAPLSWSCVAPDATHHLVLQDDVVLAEGFYEHAERAAAAAPGEAIALYAGWDSRNGAVARLAALVGAPWAYTLQEHVPCQALILPAGTARGYEAFQQEHGGGWPYDVVVQRYLNAIGMPVRFCTPSTVQHDDLPSLAGNTYHGFRQATLFTGEAGPVDAGEPCPRFPVVPFYQYGEARCAVLRGTEWEYLETERQLARTGLLDACLAALAAAGPDAAAGLLDGSGRAVWLTAFAIGVVTADRPEPDPRIAAAVLESLGTGGLCQEYTVAELLAVVPAVRDFALTALAAGRRAGADPAVRTPRPAPLARVAVTGGGPDFARQLARLLADAGHDAGDDAGHDGGHDAGRPSAGDLDGVRYVVHLGRPEDEGLLADVLAAAAKAGVERVVYAGSSAVYRGSRERTVTEEFPAAAPADPVALAWWREEQAVLAWGADHGVPVQVLRLADPVGRYAPEDSPLVRWVNLAWTRRPLALNPLGRHQVLDHRDLADALRAVLAAPPARPVLNVASAAFDEQELAGFLADVSRRTPWEWVQDPTVDRWTMATGLIGAELHWQPSAELRESMRALAQWWACDIHGDYTVAADRTAPAVPSGPDARA